MSEKKTPTIEINTDILLADTLLRLSALEKLLIQKGLITRDELNNITTVLVEKVTQAVMAKVQSSKNLNEFIESLGSELKKDMKN